MPIVASTQRRFARWPCTAVLTSALLVAAPGCRSVPHGSSVATSPGNSDACSICGDEDCNAGFCLCTENYVRCFDEKQTVHDAVARANIAMRCDFASRPSADVRAGYRAAFVDIALGASGATPPVPPEKYWTACFRTADGHARAEAWFAGYRAGASRALTTCRQRFNAVPSSKETAFTTDQSASTTSDPTNLAMPPGAGW